MAHFSYFQNKIHKENNKVGNIDEERLKMAEYLESHPLDDRARDKLHDQLTWLKFQIDYCLDGGEIDLLIDDYNWVADNFNSEYDEEEFPFFNY